MTDTQSTKIAWNIVFALSNAGYLNIPRDMGHMIVPGIAKIIFEKKDICNFDEKLNK